MGKKSVLILTIIIILAATGFLLLNPTGGKNSLPVSPVTKQKETVKIQPSATLKEYADPSGFSLNYPDNLSLVKNDSADTNTYADIELSAKEISGSLNFKISDSKFATLGEWLKLNKDAAKNPPKEVKLGNLKGMEIETADRLLLGALDKGIFFNIEMPLIERDFWTKVYTKVLESFTFASTENAGSTNQAADDISFEGEEVVE